MTLKNKGKHMLNKLKKTRFATLAFGGAEMEVQTLCSSEAVKIVSMLDVKVFSLNVSGVSMGLDVSTAQIKRYFKEMGEYYGLITFNVYEDYASVVFDYARSGFDMYNVID